jgi:four helix bundle protein
VAHSRYRELLVYRRARSLAALLNSAVADWGSFARWSLGIQLVRAADSIGANIAEAHGRATLADQRRLLHIARGSLLEAEHWIDVAHERDLLDAAALEPKVVELAKLLNGLIRSTPS